MKYFLLVYDKKEGKLLDCREFPEHEREFALAEGFRTELDERTYVDREVVVLGAESLEDLVNTHSRYFEDELRKQAASLGFLLDARFSSEVSREQ
ncbi:MAG: hypothetical protein ACRDKZ_11675 [Actinomycetota bacterium]